MPDIKQSVIDRGKNKLLEATVLEVLGSRCAVQLSTNGKKLFGLPIVGGPIEAGKKVYVDVSQGKPYVQSLGEDRTQDIEIPETTRRQTSGNSETVSETNRSGTGAHTHEVGEIIGLSEQLYSTQILFGDPPITSGSTQSDGDLIETTPTLSGQVTYYIDTSGSDIKIAAFDAITELIRSIRSGTFSVLGKVGMFPPSTFWNSELYFKLYRMDTSGSDLVATSGTYPIGEDGLSFECYGEITQLWNFSASQYLRLEAWIKSYGVQNLWHSQHTLYLTNDNPLTLGLPAQGFWGDMLKSTYDPDDDGEVISSGSAGNVEWSGVVNKPTKIRLQTIFTVEGQLEVVDNPLRIYNETGNTKTVVKVKLSVDTAPTGSAIIVDIHKNGTTIFTTQSNRPQIAVSAEEGESTTIEVPSWADGDYLTMHIDQIGSSVPGSNLTVHIVYDNPIVYY